MLKKILLSLAAVGALGSAAAPAAAQPWGGNDYDPRSEQLYTPYVDSLDSKITNAAREGRISWGEARELSDEVRSIHDLAWRNQTGDLRPWEYRRLEGAVRHVEERTGYASYRAQRRGYGYGYGYGYDRNEWRR